MNEITKLSEEMAAHLQKTLLPFWSSLRDPRGGYISLVNGDLLRDPEAVHGCILNSRILWFFSTAADRTGRKDLVPLADHAYRELLRMKDEVHGGLYWSISPDGKPVDTTKHTYNQAFGIYALSAYASLTGNGGAHSQAMQLFELIETRMRDAGGYLEAFTENFSLAGNDKLSENGVEAARTMNTLLHVLEAYTALYAVSGQESVRKRMEEMLQIWEKNMWNGERRRQEVFFDRDYHSLIDLTSYGHDIETSWLLDRTLDVLGDDAVTARIRPKLLMLAEAVLAVADPQKGVPNECERGRVDESRVWWVQAEAAVGFVNAWEHTGKPEYLAAAANQWKVIRHSIVDSRPGSEWFWSVDAELHPLCRTLADP